VPTADQDGVRLSTTRAGALDRLTTITGEVVTSYVTVVNTARGAPLVIYPPKQDPRITAQLLGDGNHWAHCPGCKHCVG
jgi:hypothetical protein